MLLKYVQHNIPEWSGSFIGSSRLFEVALVRDGCFGSAAK